MHTFFEDSGCAGLYPLAEATPVAGLRIGLLTLAAKWQHTPLPAALHINARLLPTPEVTGLFAAEPHARFVSGAVVLAEPLAGRPEKTIEIKTARLLERPWQVFLWNGSEIRADIERLGLTPSDRVWPGVTVAGSHPVYAAPDAEIEPGCVLVAAEGPIVLGAGALVMAGSLLRGNVAVGDHAAIKMGAKIYADTTVGPYCKAGGELQNAVLMGYSNKGHDGYLGNSVIGYWCNLGAGTDSSNLKNNYSPVAVYGRPENGMIETGLQFCGTLMGDHAKTAIGTTLNTGTVVGSFVNLAAGGFPPKHVPSFSWVTPGVTTRFDFDRAMAMAAAMMQRRGKTMPEDELERWRAVYRGL